jgi:hypothetical protein
MEDKMTKFQTPHERQDGLVADSAKIMAIADAAKRDLTLAEQKTIKANSKNFDDIKTLIDVRETVASQEAELARRPRRRAKVIGRRDRLRGDNGFNDGFGEFAFDAAVSARSFPARETSMVSIG